MTLEMLKKEIMNKWSSLSPIIEESLKEFDYMQLQKVDYFYNSLNRYGFLLQASVDSASSSSPMLFLDEINRSNSNKHVNLHNVLGQRLYDAANVICISLQYPLNIISKVKRTDINATNICYINSKYSGSDRIYIKLEFELESLTDQQVDLSTDLQTYIAYHQSVLDKFISGITSSKKHNEFQHVELVDEFSLSFDTRKTTSYKLTDIETFPDRRWSIFFPPTGELNIRAYYYFNTLVDSKFLFIIGKSPTEYNGGYIQLNDISIIHNRYTDYRFCISFSSSNLDEPVTNTLSYKYLTEYEYTIEQLANNYASPTETEKKSFLYGLLHRMLRENIEVIYPAKYHDHFTLDRDSIYNLFAYLGEPDDLKNLSFDFDWSKSELKKLNVCKGYVHPLFMKKCQCCSNSTPYVYNENTYVCSKECLDKLLQNSEVL